MSALDNIGPHLLGRRPSPFDARDYKLQTFLSADPLDVALATLLKSHAAVATKSYAVLANPILKGARGILPTPVPPIPPPPPAPSGAIDWPDTDTVLDQGQTPHCVGFGGAQWGNTQPVDDHFTNKNGDDIYYACKVLDGEPGQEDGSDVRTLAKELVSLGRIDTYAFAGSIDEAIAFLPQGALIIGSNWTNDMFNPDGNGVVRTTGGVAGGHCYVMKGYDPATDLIKFLNSWSAGWGVNGTFFIPRPAFVSLWADGGEALAAVELPA